jgi:hypothetical protein
MLYEAHSLGEMLRKVAIDYVRFGYFRYLVLEIPRTKEPKAIDRSIITTYEITFHRTSRALKKAKGEAVVAYVRFGHRFILLATEGTHPEVDKRDFQDCRVKPIQLSGYTVGVKGVKGLKGEGQRSKVNVQMSLKRYRALRKLLSRIALHNERKLEDFFNRISPYSFPGIIRQKQKLLKMVNTKRKIAGLKPMEFKFTRSLNK